MSGNGQGVRTAAGEATIIVRVGFPESLLMRLDTHVTDKNRRPGEKTDRSKVIRDMISTQLDQLPKI